MAWLELYSADMSKDIALDVEINALKRKASPR